MKVGISTATFFLKELTEDTFSVIRRCKGDTCEVFLTTYSEYEPDFVDMLTRRKGDLDVYSVHSLNTQFEPQLFNAAARTRADAEVIYRKVLAAGRALGAKVYTFHGIPRLKKHAYVDPVSSGKRLEELGEIALEYGIRLSLENVHWAMFSYPDFFAEAKNFCPSVGAVLDIKQARQSGYDCHLYLDAIGDRLTNVHLSDVDQNGAIAMVGKGQFDFDKLIARLIDEGYGGPLLIEQYAKDYDSYDEVAEAVRFLKDAVSRNKKK